MINLRYDLQDAFNQGVNQHPQQVLKNIGISYIHATPQSIADQWWFWNCSNIPKALPPFLSLLSFKPVEAIGFGLTKEDVEKIMKS